MFYKAILLSKYNVKILKFIDYCISRLLYTWPFHEKISPQNCSSFHHIKKRLPVSCLDLLTYLPACDSHNPAPQARNEKSENRFFKGAAYKKKICAIWV